MKTLFKVLLIATLLLMGSVANAQVVVGVVFDGPTVFVNDETKMKQLDNKLLEILPAEKYQVVPTSIITAAATTYRTENSMLKDGEPDKDKPLTAAILSKLGRQAGCDYILQLDMRPLGANSESIGAFSRFSDSKALVILSLTDIRVINVDSEQYEYKKEYLSAGRHAVTRVLGIGGKPKEAKAMDDLFECFLKYLSLRPTAIP